MFRFFACLLIGGLLISCKKTNIAYEDDFNKSYQSWLSFKDANNNSYQYMVATSSWTGYSSETILTVTNGKVTGRSFVARSAANDGTNSIITLQQWTEDADQLNTYPSGATILTLDDIYQEAKSDWLLKRGNARTYFETNNNGMLSSCGYVEDGCMDDCFRGVTIGYIKAI